MLPMFCYGWVSFRLVILIYGRMGYFETGKYAHLGDNVRLNTKLGVSRHDFFVMSICAFYLGWAKVREIAKLSEMELATMGDYLFNNWYLPKPAQISEQ